MKRRVISAALALCMMLTLLSGTALAAGQHPFTDVPQSHWANEAVGYVYENDLMNGVSATMFQPGGSLTRAMFVTILGRMAGAEEESGESGFADVPAGRWVPMWPGPLGKELWMAQETAVFPPIAL